MAYHIVDNPTRVNRRFAEATAAFKKKYKFTDEDLSALLGVSATTISAWRRNTTAISVKNFEEVVEVLGLPESYYLMEDDDAAREMMTHVFSGAAAPAADLPLVEQDVTDASGYDEHIPDEEQEEETARPVWYAEFPSEDALVRFLVQRCPFDIWMFPLDGADEMEDYINFCLNNHYPVVIKPGD